MAVGLACMPTYDPPPPLLDRFPQRHQVRSLDQLHAEIWGDANRVDVLAREAKCQDILVTLGLIETTADIDSLREKIANLREENRRRSYRAWLATWLIELDEWLQIDGAEALGGDAERYFAWRLRTAPLAAGEPSDITAVRRLDYLGEQEYLLRQQQRVERLLIEPLRLFAELDPAFGPYIDLQRATAQFYIGSFAAARWNYEQVRDKYPSHPRAEVAQLMIGRLEMAQGVTVERSNAAIRRAQLRQGVIAEPLVHDHFKRADTAFAEYLSRYPNGRFVAVAHGWRGGAKSRMGEDLEALGHFLDQLSAQPTAEIGRAVLQDCDLVFSDLISQSEWPEIAKNLPFGKLAANPEVAQLLVYELLDPITMRRYRNIHHSGEDFAVLLSDYNLAFVRQMLSPREEGAEVLSRLATAVAEQISAKGSHVRHPAMLRSILARAAWSARDYETALDLTAGENDRLTPDNMHVRALSMAAVNDHEGLVALENDFRKLRRAPGLYEEYRFLKAKSLEGLGRAGEAVALYMEIARGQNDGLIDNSIYKRECEIRSEVLLRVAPTRQLLKGYSQALSLDAYEKDVFRRALLQRLLAEGNFTTAETLLADERDDLEHTWPEDYQAELTKARWDIYVTPIIRQRQRNLPTDPTAQAMFFQTLGEAYLTLSRHAHFGRTEDDDVVLQNAVTMGFDYEEAYEAIARSSTLFHALENFDKAAEVAVGDREKAEALEKANETLREYVEERRFTLLPSESVQGVNERAARYVMRLREECADTLQTGRAIEWHFPESWASDRWLPGQNASWIVDAHLKSGWKNRQPDMQDERVEDRMLAGAVRLIDNILSRVLREKFDPQAMAAELREVVDGAWELSSSHQYAEQLNRGEDMALFLEQPGVTPETARVYLNFVGSPDIDRPIDPRLEPFHDFVFFSIITGGKRSEERLGLLQAFARKYPDSPKHEAALARIARDAALLTQPMPDTRRLPRYDRPHLHRFPTVVFPRRAAQDATAAQAVAKYYERYPEGRFLDDVKFIDAYIAIGSGRMDRGAEILTELMDGEKSASLDQDLGLLLAVIGLDLLDLDRRTAAVSALRNNPELTQYLRQLGERGTFLWRLEPFWKHISTL